MNALIEKVKDGWIEYDLINSQDIIKPTFIEEVGSASAENTRTAALKRWACKNPEVFANWIYEVTNVELPCKWNIQREYTLFKSNNKINRVDLAVFHGNNRELFDLFVESKWKSIPSLKQILDYNDVMTNQSIVAPLLLLSPVPLLMGSLSELPPLVKQVDWTTLSKFIPPEKFGGDLEHDLGRTLFRWKHLKDSLCCYIKDCSEATTKDLSELMNWIKCIHEREATEYYRLTPLLVLNEISDQMLQQTELLNWMKFGIGVGAHGTDCSVDLCSNKKEHYFIPISNNTAKGVNVTIRSRIRHKDYRIELQIGSNIQPYDEPETSDDIQHLFNKAEEVRKCFYSKLSDMGIKANRSTDARQRWQHSCSLLNKDLIEMKTNAVRLSEIVEEVLTQLH